MRDVGGGGARDENTAIVWRTNPVADDSPPRQREKSFGTIQHTEPSALTHDMLAAHQARRDDPTQPARQVRGFAAAGFTLGDFLIQGRGRVRIQVDCISGPCHPPQVGGGWVLLLIRRVCLKLKA